MTLTCPLCSRAFHFPLKLLTTLGHAEVAIRNPGVQIICRECGNRRVRELRPGK